MSIKEKFFRNVVVNVLIVAMLCTVCFFGFNAEVKQVFNPNKLKAIYNGNTNNANVSLMVNVYWGTEFLDEMLDIFERTGTKVTFFVGGMWACENEEYLQKFVLLGHEIGNHGYYHKEHSKLSRERNEEEIYITHQLVKSLAGVEMNLFAPPSGDFNDLTLEVADKLGYKTIMWTKDTIDWRDKDTDLIYTRATAKASNGDLILMHPTKNTVEALPAIINFYKNKGFNLTTVTTNITV
ncbi:MAG: polysaccharide deacetylase family protein [Christensenellales bacterium]